MLAINHSVSSVASHIINSLVLDDYCNTTWDGLSCWPPTKAGTTVIIKCMEFLNRVPYDTTQNATRECHANGTWAPRSDYSECRPLDQKDESFENLWDIKDAHTIYSIGYGLSLIALVIALWIFLYFSDLRCLRNTIHTNLLVTYLFIDLTWIITAALQTSTSNEANKRRNNSFSASLLDISDIVVENQVINCSQSSYRAKLPL
ncbi:diuretic hormone receptor [Trichonephila clavata]|uniref:Diuretic hormone receptor n=1 Tax=Trichonephila clavata TaxID=2740835 RepID=A0A8X6J2M9_TRICU|nr:diuretic hormone receptor [Trichonephila clavata]